MAIKEDRTIIRRDSYDWVLTVTEGGSVKNITGSTIYLTVKDKSTYKDDTSDDDALIQVVVTSHTNPTQGITVISLSADDTNVSNGVYYYDIQIVESSGKVTTLKYGDFTIIADVTVENS